MINVTEGKIRASILPNFAVVVDNEGIPDVVRTEYAKDYSIVLLENATLDECRKVMERGMESTQRQLDIINNAPLFKNFDNEED